MPEHTGTPLLDRVVDEVLRGERVVLFPPGIAAFVTANMTFMLGSSLLCAVALPPLFGPAMPARAIAPLIGLGGALLSVFPPAFLVAQGRANGRRAFAAVTLTWLAFGALALVGSLTGALPVRPSLLLLSVSLLTSSWCTTRTAPYRTFEIFKQRLRTRRLELFDRLATSCTSQPVDGRGRARSSSRRSARGTGRISQGPTPPMAAAGRGNGLRSASLHLRPLEVTNRPFGRGVALGSTSLGRARRTGDERPSRLATRSSTCSRKRALAARAGYRRSSMSPRAAISSSSCAITART